MIPIVNKINRAIGCFAVFAMVLAISCGKSGDKKDEDSGTRPPPGENPDGEGEDTDGDEDGDRDLKLTTDVGIAGFSYEIPFLASCMRSQAAPKLVNLGTVHLDGDFGEWPDDVVEVFDPIGDSHVTAEVALTLAARSGDDLILGLVANYGNESSEAPSQPTQDFSLEIELGGALVSSNEWRTEIRQFFRVEGHTVHRWHNGQFEALDQAKAAVAFGSNGIELRLGAEILGDVGAWPAWWIRLTSSTSHGKDRVPAIYLPSMLETDDPSVVLGGCTKWSGQAADLVFQYLHDARSLAAENFPIELVAERAFQIMRLAFDATMETLGYPALPLAQIPVLITQHSLAEPIIDLKPSGNDDQAAAYRGFRLDVSKLGPSSTDPFPQGEIFEAAASYILDLFLADRFPAAPGSLRRAFRTRLLDGIVQRHLGMSYWLDHYREGVIPFANALDQDQPLGLLSMEALLDAGGPFPADRSSFAGVFEAKSRAFGHMLGRYLNEAAMVKVWTEVGAAAHADEDAMSRAVMQSSAKHAGDTDAHQTIFQKHWRGWVTDETYDDGEMRPGMAADEDVDGLPGFLEGVHGTNPLLADTDGDGWTDAGEVLSESDPLAKTASPSTLVPDGDFSDWLELLPRKVADDLGHSGECPQASDITHYSAVANSDELLIGAHAREFLEREPKARWEAVIDLADEDRRLIMTATAGSYEYEISDAATRQVIFRHKRAIPMGRGVIEWSMQRRALDLKRPLNKPGDVSIRLRSLYEEGGQLRVCDETAWFKPYVTAS